MIEKKRSLGAEIDLLDDTTLGCWDGEKVSVELSDTLTHITMPLLIILMPSSYSKLDTCELSSFHFHFLFWVWTLNACRLQLGCSSVEKSFCRIIRLFDPHHIARELASHIFSLPHFQINQLETYKIEGQKVDIINPLSLHSELLRN